MMTINALACVDSGLIPVQVAYLLVKGLQQLIKTIGRVKKQLNPKLKIEGILLTMVDNRTNYARDISLMVYDTYSSSIKVFGTEIPMSVRASEVSVEREKPKWDDTITNRMLHWSYTPEQKEEVKKALAAGVPKATILTYFYPEVTVEKMRSYRKKQ
jgi:cellulose biosynthesis protein BcsQ